MLYILCTVGLKMQLIGYLDDYAWGCCKWLAMAPLTRQACGRALARLARAEAGRPVGRLLHTGIFDQNPFHSTTYSAPGMARILKEAKLHGKFECVWLMCWYSTRFGPNISTTPITAMGCRQCLPLSVVQLKGKHCRKPHCRNGVVDTFGHWLNHTS